MKLIRTLQREISSSRARVRFRIRAQRANFIMKWTLCWRQNYIFIKPSFNTGIWSLENKILESSSTLWFTWTLSCNEKLYILCFNDINLQLEFTTKCFLFFSNIRHLFYMDHNDITNNVLLTIRGFVYVLTLFHTRFHTTEKVVRNCVFPGEEKCFKIVLYTSMRLIAQSHSPAPAQTHANAHGFTYLYLHNIYSTTKRNSLLTVI